MNFVEDRKQAMGAAFNGAWRVCTASPEATDTEPFGAWMVVEVDDVNNAPCLRLRLVRDRGQNHVDVELRRDGKHERWVPLEIFAVAAAKPDFNALDKYVAAFKATLDLKEETLDLKGECVMLKDPLDFVADNMPALAKVSANGHAIREAEACVAAATTAALTGA